MLQEVHEALETRDVVLVLMDASRRVQLEAAGEPAQAHQRKSSNWASEDEFLLSLIKGLDCPVFLVSDEDRSRCEGRAAAADRNADEAVQLCGSDSSQRAEEGWAGSLSSQDCGCAAAGGAVLSKGPVHGSAERFMVAELIRERILVETGEEVPYAAAVVIERLRGAAARAAAQEESAEAAADPDCGGDLLRARRAEGDSDRQGRREAEGDRDGGAQADRVAAGDAGVSGTARHRRAELAGVAGVCGFAGLAAAIEV